MQLKQMLQIAGAVAASGALLVVAEAAYVLLITPRLRHADGTDTGNAVRGTTTVDSTQHAPTNKYELDVLFLGDSLTAGVGCTSHAKSVCGTAAERLASHIHKHRTTATTPQSPQSTEALQTDVKWLTIARTGYVADKILQRLVPRISWLPPKESDIPRIVVISCTVNDALFLHTTSKYKADMLQLIAAVRKKSGDDTPVILMRSPPSEQFPALPFPLNRVIGWRVDRMGAAALEVSRKVPHCYYAEIDTIISHVDFNIPGFYASDNFHPGDIGARILGEATADWMIKNMPLSELGLA